MRLLLCLVVFLFVLVDAAAWAADRAQHTGCTCRNRDGSRHQLGAVACLNVDGRRYLARCEMALNVPNWKKVQDECPAAAAAGQPSATPAAL